MANSYSDAVRNGTLGATRVQKRLSIKDEINIHGGQVDVFDAFHKIGLELLFRPLDGLLGAYLTDPVPGVLITTQREMSIQRFTAAHELGHFSMDHKPSLDDENLLRRATVPEKKPGMPLYEEIEADAFAAEFLMPRWLMLWHIKRQNWTGKSLSNPTNIYQLSLRVGASFEATCRTLFRQKLLDRPSVERLLGTRPKEMKADLLREYKPSSYRGNVWLLTENDADTRIDGSRHDYFVLRLNEHSGSGYLWNFEQLKSSGFCIVHDEQETIDSEAIGGATCRCITASLDEAYKGKLSVNETRPWDPKQSLSDFTIDVDMTGPEEKGLSRASKRRLLEAA